MAQRALYALLGIALSSLLLAVSAKASTTEVDNAHVAGNTVVTNGACGFSEHRESQPGELLACTFVQDGAKVSIAFADGRQFYFSPRGDAPGDYRDVQGQPVYRQKSHGLQGQMFRLGQRFLFVLWQAPAATAIPSVAAHPSNYRSGVDGLRWHSPEERIYYY